MNSILSRFHGGTFKSLKTKNYGFETQPKSSSWKLKRQSLSRVWLFAMPWTVAHQAPLPMGFSRQEYWSGLPFPSPGDLPSPGLPYCSQILHHLSHQGSPRILEWAAYPPPIFAVVGPTLYLTWEEKEKPPDRSSHTFNLPKYLICSLSSFPVLAMKCSFY